MSFYIRSRGLRNVYRKPVISWRLRSNRAACCCQNHRVPLLYFSIVLCLQPHPPCCTSQTSKWTDANHLPVEKVTHVNELVVKQRAQRTPERERVGSEPPIIGSSDSYDCFRALMQLNPEKSGKSEKNLGLCSVLFCYRFFHHTKPSPKNFWSYAITVSSSRIKPPAFYLSFIPNSSQLIPLLIQPLM